MTFYDVMTGNLHDETGAIVAEFFSVEEAQRAYPDAELVVYFDKYKEPVVVTDLMGATAPEATVYRYSW